MKKMSSPNLVGLEVHMDRVHPAAGAVLDDPTLGRAEFGVGVIAFGVEELAVDDPRAVASLELEDPCPDDLALQDRDVRTQRRAGPDGRVAAAAAGAGGPGVVVGAVTGMTRRGLRYATDDELHDRRAGVRPVLRLVDVFLRPPPVVEVVGEVVGQEDLVGRVGEIDDHLGPLRGAGSLR